MPFDGERLHWFKFTEYQKEVKKPLDTYLFCIHPILHCAPLYDKNAIPIIFRASPDTLLNLCCKVVDAIPLPSVYEWSTVDVCRWIRRYGYPQYIGTFRDNYINGRTLLLLTASNLSAMNIKNFDDIRHIAYGIRSLFYFEMTKFARSISLPPEYYYELYKLFRVQNGPKYENMRRSEFWRHLKLIREKSPNYSHWELLTRWLAMIKDPKYNEIVNNAPRRKLYLCDNSIFLPKDVPKEDDPSIVCGCDRPCECCWSAKNDLRKSWRLSFLPPKKFEAQCPTITDDSDGVVYDWYLNFLKRFHPMKYDMVNNRERSYSTMTTSPSYINIWNRQRASSISFAKY